MPKYSVTVNHPTAGDADLLLGGTGGGVVHNGETVVVNMSEEDYENMKADQSGVFTVKEASADAKAVNDPLDPWPSEHTDVEPQTKQTTTTVVVPTGTKPISEGGES